MEQASATPRPPRPPPASASSAGPAGYVADRERFVQKAVGWWLRSLSLHDPDRVRAFLDGPGRELKPFARREAAAGI